MKTYSPTEAAKILNASPLTVRHWLRTKELKGTKKSNQWEISQEDLQEFMINRKGGKGNSSIAPNDTHNTTIGMERPSKHSPDYEWEIYGRKVFEEMRKDGLEKHFEGIYVTCPGEAGEKYKSYKYNGESFRLFLSANEMRIVILRPNTFLAPGGASEDLKEFLDTFGIDITTDVLLYQAYRGEFNQQTIKDSRRTKE